MSNRFRPAWLLVLAALSTSSLAKAPETVSIGLSKGEYLRAAEVPRHTG
ncbi:Uncharacterised protein [Klebsiella pneumoniae]|nr:Uncharacterised protein [Klebsiella pneumoniae]